MSQEEGYASPQEDGSRGQCFELDDVSMYVMLSWEDPRCPKCHNATLLDFNDGHPAPPAAAPVKRRAMDRADRSDRLLS
ncbi:hypothetical protein U9M48_004315 [Paspalum notatum var. saurae]|uniref:GIR1-like zinc ribbon domain-containing protein n=1 Tax=Paspalum notatum var. saurae TaxID=547442 RepID=A0AAQ3SIY6_PASNO